MHLGRHQHVRPEGERRRMGRPTHPRRDRTPTRAPRLRRRFKGKMGKLGLPRAKSPLPSDWGGLPGPWLHREDAGCGARRTLQRVRRVARIASAHAVDA
eukprot:7078673-Prymnesium_polylepis.1